MKAEAMAPPLGEQYEDHAKQGHAARLGMWAFLGSEALLFAGLFALYGAYRGHYREAFHQAGAHMDVTLGTVNTFILLTSSLTVALAVWAARAGRPRAIVPLLGTTLAFAAAFLVLKGIEYAQHFREGLLPGRYYANVEMPFAGAKIFTTLYFFMTGLHAIHVVVGMIVLAWALRRALRLRWTPEHHTGLELGAMYWHLVDLIWIFLWPLLYLVD
jgi:cytochrome c oxidase subunit III